MPLTRLLRLLFAVLLLLMAARVGRMTTVEWQAVRHASASEVAVQQLRLGLLAAEMVSRERGPSNAVLGAALPAKAEQLQALQVARERTDQALAALQQVLPLADPEATRRTAAQQLAQASLALREARAAVDHTAALALDLRSPEALRGAVNGMVAVVPQLAPAIGLLANEAQQAYPGLSEEVQAARLSAELREYAGLLGSHLTPALARQQPLTGSERLAIERTRGRIDELRFLVSLRVQVPGQEDSVLQAWQRVEMAYFQRASLLVAQVVDTGEHDGRYGMDAAGFAALYVPDMNTLLALRDALLQQAAERATAEHQRAQTTLVWVAVGSLLLLLVLGTTLVVIHRRVLRPLAQTARALRALANRELEAPLPEPLADDEMAAVIGAAHTLQVQTRQREALERERDELIDLLREQSNTDFLTGLPNRRAFFAAAERDLALAERHGFGVVVILLDVDYFKLFNDSLGHAAGDQALTEVALAVRRALRQGDLVARFGGEEFVLLLSHSDQARGERFAQRLRAAIAEAPIPGPQGEVVHVTASLGVADSAHWGLNLELLLSQADKAMYEAKQAGRNCVAVARIDGVRLVERQDPPDTVF